MRNCRALFAVWWVSVQRLAWSLPSALLLFPLLACGLFLIYRRYDNMPFVVEAFRKFSNEFVLLLFVPILVPIIALAYGTSTLGSEREDRTLIYLLLRPIPRWQLVLAKFLAALPLVCGVSLASFAIFAQLAGPAGRQSFLINWPAVALLAASYTALFVLCSVWFRYASIVALVYALFVEFFIGNMPGMIKQLAVNFYGRSLVLAWSEPHGLPLPKFELFAPVAASTALWSLGAILVVTLLLAIVSFEWCEYRDLT